MLPDPSKRRFEPTYILGRRPDGNIKEQLTDCEWISSETGRVGWIEGKMKRPMWGKVEFRFRYGAKWYKGEGEIKHVRHLGVMRIYFESAPVEFVPHQP